MAGYCSTGQSPQRAVVLMEEKEEEEEEKEEEEKEEEEEEFVEWSPQDGAQAQKHVGTTLLTKRLDLIVHLLQEY